MTDQTEMTDVRQRIAHALEREDAINAGYDHGFVGTYGIDPETDGFVDAVLAVVSAPVQPTTRADDEGDELVCVDQCGSCDACGMEPFGTPAEGWREASRFLRRVARTSGNREGALHGARLIEVELRRMAGEEQPATETPSMQLARQSVQAMVDTITGQRATDASEARQDGASS
ncbi:hypothetical protein [Streptomyces sp. NPDC093269]|uniref:hypothetical protein n=1 Tax=Streptomyces sp. NPDC093269 TaxID=3366038 RepID=UPI0037F609B6